MKFISDFIYKRLRGKPEQEFIMIIRFTETVYERDHYEDEAFIFYDVNTFLIDTDKILVADDLGTFPTMYVRSIVEEAIKADKHKLSDRTLKWSFLDTPDWWDEFIVDDSVKPDKEVFYDVFC